MKFQVSRQYEPHRNLISSVSNSVAGMSAPCAVNSFAYQNDELGRRTRIDTTGTAFGALSGSHWDYTYNDRNEVIGGSRFSSTGKKIPGMQFGYGYDSIGNRTFAEQGAPDNRDLYKANRLNQIEQRNVSPYFNVTGTAASNAVVSVGLIDLSTTNLTPAVSSIIRASRMDKFFHLLYPVDNMTSSFTGFLDITGVINPAGHTDLDVVTSEVRSVFKAQTPEKRIYDDDGNLLKDGHWTYTWNAENRLIAVSNQTGLVASYAYDYRGRRISKAVNGETTTFLWNGNHIIHEESSTRTNTYTWGQNGHLVSATLSGTNVFYAHDGNKNITDLVDTSGNAVAHYEFDPYGNITVKTGVLADANPFRFSNEYYDPETGLVTYLYRPYNPPLGCFLNRDPIEEEGGLRLIGFVGNDPINKTDYLGLTWVGQILNEFFLPFGNERTWIMDESDRYTSIVRNWSPVQSEVDNVMASVSSNPKKWEKSHMTTKSWHPGPNERGDPARGYFSDVSDPSGTSPDIARREFEKYFWWLIQTDALHTSAIGSFRTHGTVDEIDTACKTATLNIWISNTMDRNSFGRFVDEWQFRQSPMEPQHMWWNWTQEFTFDGKGGFTLGTGDDSGW